MSLGAKDVAEIMRLLEASAFDELKLETGDLKIHLRRKGAPVREEAPASVAVPSPAPPPAQEKARPALDPGLAEIPSPLLGTFYRAPKPGEPPFVDVGSQVEEDTIIGIIEVMKLMNTVRAGVRGEIAGIVAQNAALVEYGEPLMHVRAA